MNEKEKLIADMLQELPVGASIFDTVNRCYVTRLGNNEWKSSDLPPINRGNGLVDTEGGKFDVGEIENNGLGCKSCGKIKVFWVMDMETAALLSRQLLS